MSYNPSMQDAKPQTLRVMQPGRLAYYRAAADGAYWDRHWTDALRPETFREAEAGGLGRFEQLFTRWLPRRGRILEAGCGTGVYVAALRARGYDVEGVEWGEATVAAVNRIVPDLPVRVGDVTRLDEPDGAFAGYISIGVMEHREAGPQPFLRETFRILQPGGIALISVPHLHGLRRLKGKLGLYDRGDGGLPFYQYVYATDVFAGFVQEAGFEIEAVQPYDGFKGIKDELPGSRGTLRLLKKSRWTKPRLEGCRWGHMAMFVCRRPEVSAQEAADQGGAR